MQAKPVHYSKLSDVCERDIARYATMARNDTIDGGASAMADAKRSKLPYRDELIAAVSAVYSLSSSKPHDQYDAWECSECGSVHLGREAAELCCEEEYFD